jgi:hypothetical protein
MKVEIYDLWRNGRTIYFWTLYDGPDGIDKVSGYATTLEETVAKILEWRERIGRDYFESTIDETASERVGDSSSVGSKHSDHRLRDDGDSEAGSEY